MRKSWSLLTKLNKAVFANSGHDALPELGRYHASGDAVTVWPWPGFNCFILVTTKSLSQCLQETPWAGLKRIIVDLGFLLFHPIKHNPSLKSLEMKAKWRYFPVPILHLLHTRIKNAWCRLITPGCFPLDSLSRISFIMQYQCNSDTVSIAFSLSRYANSFRATVVLVFEVI